MSEQDATLTRKPRNGWISLTRDAGQGNATWTVTSDPYGDIYLNRRDFLDRHTHTVVLKFAKRCADTPINQREVSNVVSFSISSMNHFIVKDHDLTAVAGPERFDTIKRYIDDTFNQKEGEL